MKKLLFIFLIFISLTGLAKETTPSDSILNCGRFSIGINLSPDICYRSIKKDHGNDPITETIIIFDNKEEIPKFGYSGGINVCYKYSKHFSFETGIQYSNKGYSDKKSDWSNLTFGDMIDPRYGFVYQTQVPTGLKSFQVRFNYLYLDVPIRAIYSFGKKRFSFLTSIGVTTGYLMKANSTVIKRFDNGDVKRTNQKQIDNFNDINISTSVSLGVAYRVNKKIDVKIEPTFRYGLTKIENYEIANYLWSAGLNFSCYYKLK